MVVRFCGLTAKTKTQEDRIDPQWYQSLYLPEDSLHGNEEEKNENNDAELKVPKDIELAPGVYCEIFDEDWERTKDQSLGRFSIDAEDILNGDHKEAKWYDLQDAENKPVCGQVLASFELIDHPGEEKESRPNLKALATGSGDNKRLVNIYTLGLRDIQSRMGCNKPFTEFEINGLKYSTETSNIPTSRNPNFCQILKFQVTLPDEDTYFPNLNLTVKDSLFGGLIKRTLGYASIEVKELLEEKDITESIFRETLDDKELKAIREQANDEAAEEEEQKYAGVDRPQSEQAPSVVDENAPLKKKDLEKDQRPEGIERRINKDDKKAEKIAESKQNKKSANLYMGFECTEPHDFRRIEAKYMKGRLEEKDELEDRMQLSPFLKIPFKTGTNPERNVGYFKGLISFNKIDNDETGELGSDFKYLKEMTKPVDLYLRLYILNGINLTPQDRGDSADPYLIVKIGKEKYGSREEYMEKTLNPKFCQTFEIPITMPGPSQVEIQVWDWDGIGSDLIGKTSIDIEDRWYSKAWRNLEKKTIEQRTLWSDESAKSRGKLRMWMEMVRPSEIDKYPLENIKPAAKEEYELRIIVWECKNCPIMDDFTDMNDLYISCKLRGYTDKDIQQETDLHFRSQNGCGSFNWRMKFPIKLPIDKPKSEYPDLQFQIWDKDFFSTNDNIAEYQFKLFHFLRYCEKNCTDKRCVYEYEGDDEFWLTLRKRNNGRSEDASGDEQVSSSSICPCFGVNNRRWNIDKHGQIKISIELLPMDKAKQYPAGFGRDAPNRNPYLPDPKGRAKFSILRPVNSLRNLLGDRMCFKLSMTLLLLMCIGFLVMITPNLLSSIAANLVSR